MEQIAEKNQVFKTIFRGAGAYRHFIPAMVKNVTSKENLLTAYTPYQAEISQGILQSIFEYQTMICDLTGMDVSNASVYDGATAAAEGVAMCQDRKRHKALISGTVPPYVLEVVETYCFGNGMELEVIPEKDGVTDKEYLKEHTKKDYHVYEADEDAEYESIVEIDLSEVRPTVAFPHLPGNAKTIDEIEAMEPIKIDQVVIGSCTNGRMEDMRKAAAILQGHTVHPDVRVMVIPATQKIYKQCIREGLLEIFVDAGCAVNTPSCGPCMGGHMGVMAAGEKCVSTTNRNFVGRMGHVDSLIYLASPEVAAASAIAGYIANSRESR